MAIFIISAAVAFLLSAVCPVHSAPVDGSIRFEKRDDSSIPDYALTYAPYIYIYSGEAYFPSDIAIHVQHVSMEADYVNVSTTVTLEDLDTFSSDDYMTSYDNPETDPAWQLSDYGIPDSSGYSEAPGTIIAVNKTIDGTDYTDVFYFTFWSFNHGQTVLDTVFDDHVGDWEHIMIRFANSTPLYIYLSEHSTGSAYEWDVMDFDGDRPIVYAANGSHANYATSGNHDLYIQVVPLIIDYTDAGYYWDMTQNYRGFWYDDLSTFTSAGGVSTGGTEQETEGVDWLYWLGYWGDEQYPTSDPRQDCLLDDVLEDLFDEDICHFTSGPTGPYDKNLSRTAVCEDEDDCTIYDNIDEESI